MESAAAVSAFCAYGRYHVSRVDPPVTYVVHIADDSYNRQPASIRTVHADALAEGIGIGPEALGHVFAYDGNRFASLIVEIGEKGDLVGRECSWREKYRC